MVEVAENKTDIALKIPKGFKQTEVGLIPEDWEVTELDEIISFQGGSQPPIEHFRFKETEGYIRLVQIRDYKTDNAKTFIPIKLARRFCEADDVMIGRYGPPIFQILRGIKGAYNVALIKAKPKGISKELCYHILKQDTIFSFVEKLSKRTGGQTGVNLTVLRTFKIPFSPTKAEQTAIATALSDMDALIEAQEQLIAKKRAIKQGAMQELLTGRKRLVDIQTDGFKQTELGLIPEDWDVVNLIEIGQSLAGLTYSPSNVNDYGTLVLRSSNVQDGRLAFKDNVFVEMDLPSRVIVKEGDILICVRNGSKKLIGKCALIDKKTEGSAFGAFMSVFRC